MTRADPNKLTPKQEKFVEQYLLDLNQTAAAVRAGYAENSAKATACELMKEPKIREKIQAAMDARSKRTEITADYVLGVVKDTVERCRQAEPVMEWDPVEKSMVPTGEYKFDSRGVLKGCEMLGKHIKLWDEPPKVDINLNLGTLSDEQLEQRIKDLEAKLK